MRGLWTLFFGILAFAFFYLLIPLLLFLFCGCSTWWIDKINGLPDENKINATSEQRAILHEMKANAEEAIQTAEQYDPPSKDSPYWRQFYDPELTDALNRPSGADK